MGSDYLVGTASEQQRAVGVQGAARADARGAVQGAGTHHAVAPAAVIEGSDVAIALCGATVRVWRAASFPYPGANSDDIDEVCLELVAAARRSAASKAEADEKNP
jgi:hypothetical protein